jgi:cyanobactin maturation PatA/PatG family protease
LGISRDTVAANAAFAHKYQFPFPLLSDTTGEVCRAYGACAGAPGEAARRMTFVIGPDRIIRRVYEQVHPEGHIETVLAFLKAAAHPVKPDVLSTGTTPQPHLGGGRQYLWKGAQQTMVEQQNDQGDHQVGEMVGVGPPDFSGALWSEQGEQGVRPAGPDAQEGGACSLAAAGRSMSLEQTPAVMPSHTRLTAHSSSPQLVFALGAVGYDFGAEARRDSIMQHMSGPNNPTPNPYDPAQLLAYLEPNPQEAEALIWTLNLDATPIYAVMPRGPFASTAYERLRQFLREQLTEGVERVSIGGMIIGQTRLLSGQVVPVIWPELRGMYSWTTAALVEAVADEPPSDSAKPEKREAYDQKVAAVTNFLERIYFELRNLGMTPQERAINYTAANAATAAGIFEAELKAERELDTIEVERSPICRPGAECWDVKLTFFNPTKVFEQARKVYRFTVDVSEACPVMVGKMRSWFVR